MCFYDIVSNGMVTHGKELLIRFTIRFLYHVKRNDDKSLNKVDVHNCRLYVKIEIETKVCAQMGMIIRLTEVLV